MSGFFSGSSIFFGAILIIDQKQLLTKQIKNDENRVKSAKGSSDSEW